MLNNGKIKRYRRLAGWDYAKGAALVMATMVKLGLAK